MYQNYRVSSGDSTNFTLCMQWFSSSEDLIREILETFLEGEHGLYVEGYMVDFPEDETIIRLDETQLKEAEQAFHDQLRETLSMLLGSKPVLKRHDNGWAIFYDE
jgi:hypothetical protein